MRHPIAVLSIVVVLAAAATACSGEGDGDAAAEAPSITAPAAAEGATAGPVPDLDLDAMLLNARDVPQGWTRRGTAGPELVAFCGAFGGLAQASDVASARFVAVTGREEMTQYVAAFPAGLADETFEDIEETLEECGRYADGEEVWRVSGTAIADVGEEAQAYAATPESGRDVARFGVASVRGDVVTVVTGTADLDERTFRAESLAQRADALVRQATAGSP